MNRRASIQRLVSAAGRRVLIGALCLLAPAGCAHQTTSARFQAADETEVDRYAVKTIGDLTIVGNAQPIQVAGVGLVVGLEGTGGEPAPDGLRQMLEDQLRKQGNRNVKEILSSPNHALVLVSAKIPPGARKNDRVDVEVALPQRGGKAVSLRGGYLKECLLFDYDSSKHLSPSSKDPDTIKLGHPLVKAEGALLVGLGGPDAGDRNGRIWNGGRVQRENPFALVLNPDQQFASIASAVADRVNDTFQGGARGSAESSVAVARDKVSIPLRVPPQYKLNEPRYLRVVRLIPIRDANASADETRNYRQKLAKDLIDPARTVTAALRLEALGQDSIPALKTGLTSQHPLVRFCSAETLAYLGSAAAGDELAVAVVKQPAFRAYALTALASLDESVSPTRLRELLESSNDDQIRYGAFRALVANLAAREDDEPALKGDLLNDSFYLYKAAPGTAPLIHYSTMGRAEIVLFGEEPFLKAPFSILAGEYTVTAQRDDTLCTVRRVPLHTGAASPPRQCSLKVEDVLRTMADLGCQYPEALEMLRQADSVQCLTCRIRADALPQVVSVYALQRAGKAAPGEDDVIQPVAGEQDLGLTPTLFQVPKPLPQQAPTNAGS